MIDNKCIVLNSTYEPLTIVSSKRALILYLEGKAHIVKNHDAVVRSPTTQFHLPSTIALKRYIKNRQLYRVAAPLTQKNLHVRDNNTCQYCSRKIDELRPSEKMTRDHIIPSSRGGQNNWLNVVVCCSTCNNKKGDNWLHNTDLQLIREPRVPSVFEIYTKMKMGDVSFSDLY